MDNDTKLDFVDTDDYDVNAFASSSNDFGRFGLGTQSQAHDFFTQSQFTQAKTGITQSEYASQLDPDASGSSSSVIS